MFLHPTVSVVCFLSMHYWYKGLTLLCITPTEHEQELVFQLPPDFNICILLMCCSTEARIHTEVQAGPLYRVLGSRLAISCNASGFANEEARQNFEFRIKRPQNPNLEVNIISTNDDSFAYAMYSQRVMQGEITLTHLSVNSVIFVIESLQNGDEGEYHCSVVNSEFVFDGTYNAITTVKGNHSPIYLPF